MPVATMDTFFHFSTSSTVGGWQWFACVHGTGSALIDDCCCVRIQSSKSLLLYLPPWALEPKLRRAGAVVLPATERSARVARADAWWWWWWRWQQGSHRAGVVVLCCVVLCYIGSRSARRDRPADFASNQSDASFTQRTMVVDRGGLGRVGSSSAERLVSLFVLVVLWVLGLIGSTYQTLWCRHPACCCCCRRPSCSSTLQQPQRFHSCIYPTDSDAWRLGIVDASCGRMGVAMQAGQRAQTSPVGWIPLLLVVARSVCRRSACISLGLARSGFDVTRCCSFVESCLVDTPTNS